MSLAISVGCASRCLCVYLKTQQQQTTHTSTLTYTLTHIHNKIPYTPTHYLVVPPASNSLCTYNFWDLSCQDLTKWNQLPWSKLMDRLHGPHHDDARQLEPSAKVSLANSLRDTPPSQIWNHSVLVLVSVSVCCFCHALCSCLRSAALPALLLLFYCIQISFYYFLNIYLGAQIRNSTFTTSSQVDRPRHVQELIWILFCAI